MGRKKLFLMIFNSDCFCDNYLVSVNMCNILRIFWRKGILGILKLHMKFCEVQLFFNSYF